MQARHPNMVREAVSRFRIQKKELATRAGLNEMTLTSIESPDWNPKWSTLDALCAAAEEIRAERA